MKHKDNNLKIKATGSMNILFGIITMSANDNIHLYNYRYSFVHRSVTSVMYSQKKSFIQEFLDNVIHQRNKFMPNMETEQPDHTWQYLHQRMSSGGSASGIF